MRSRAWPKPSADARPCRAGALRSVLHELIGPPSRRGVEERVQPNFREDSRALAYDPWRRCEITPCGKLYASMRPSTRLPLQGQPLAAEPADFVVAGLAGR